MNIDSKKILILILALASLFILQGFVFPIILGMIGALLAYNMFDKLNLIIKSKQRTALIITILTSLFIILPLFFMIVNGIQNIVELLSNNNTAFLLNKIKLFWINNNSFIFEKMKLIGMNKLEVDKNFQMLLSKISEMFLNYTQLILKQVPSLLFSVFIVISSFYLTLSNSENLKKWAISNPWLNEKDAEDFINILKDVSYSVIFAALISAILQMSVIFFAAILSNSDNILILTVGTFFLSFVPVVGTAPITLSLLIYSWANQQYSAFIIYLIAVILLTVVDNFIKPLLIGNKTNLHPFLAFLSALGGLGIFGFYGLFFGPIILAVFLKTIKIHKINL